jgi:hypothetical protein|tara:strand:+ start:1674 stop:2021 length:348 start_codon:yes stop_codon:yes gene_type:complete
MSKNEFILPQGRLAKVMSDQTYGQIKQKKIKDYINPKGGRCGRESNMFKDKDSLKDQKDCPDIQHKIPNLLKGNPDKKFNKDDVFETGKKEIKKNKNKKQHKKPIKNYKNDFHFN